MTLERARAALRRNRWLRWQGYLAAVLVANTIRLIATYPASKASWSELVAPVLFVPFLACTAMALRLSDIQRRQREAEQVAARELRTPRAPDAGPDQCPVCGGYGLDALAADDAFMERGKLAKVVAWGKRRAHWSCAEFVPYVAPPSRFQCRWCGHCETAADDDERKRLEIKHAECEQYWGPPKRLTPRLPSMEFEVGGVPTYTFRGSREAAPLGGYWRCRFCRAYRWAPTMQAAKERLIEHARQCPKRLGAPGKLRASIEVDWQRAAYEMLRDKGWRE